MATKLVGAITTLSRDLALRVVAEGVETRDQWDMIRSTGCDRAQGYLIARPSSGLALALLLTEGTLKQFLDD